MNVEEAVRRLNGYLQRRGTVDGSGGWTEQWLLDALTDANNEIYHKAVRFGPSFFLRESRFTYEKDEPHVNLADKTGGRILEIGYLGHLDKDADISKTNIPVQISMPRRTDLDSIAGGTGGTISSTSGVTQSSDPFLLGSFGQYHAWYVGDRLIIRGIPQKDLYILMRWCPDELPSLQMQDQQLLDGQLAHFHRAVVLRAAICAKIAKGEDTTQLDAMYQDMVGPYDANLRMVCSTRQSQQPSQRDPMRWEY
tara:strand:- start:7080 stop:7835 length:756 start_codon:yes stop_codon:yes gene_type:complete